jgi:hypothetical protein
VTLGDADFRKSPYKKLIYGKFLKTASLPVTRVICLDGEGYLMC